MAIVKSFEALKALAKFDLVAAAPELPAEKPESNKAKRSEKTPDNFDESEVPLNLSYTIYLNLPKTDDIAVFNAIFKSLKENFFRR